MDITVLLRVQSATYPNSFLEISFGRIILCEKLLNLNFESSSVKTKSLS